MFNNIQKKNIHSINENIYVVGMSTLIYVVMILVLFLLKTKVLLIKG